jgi:hypothetical protein
MLNLIIEKSHINYDVANFEILSVKSFRSQNYAQVNNVAFIVKSINN